MSQFIKTAAVVAIAAGSTLAAFDSYTIIDDAFIAPGANHKRILDSTLNLTIPYYLDDIVTVEQGCTLIVRPGTWIYGGLAKSDVHRPGMLIVAAGGYVDIQGTDKKPVVFTAEGDDPRDPLAFGPGAHGFWRGIMLIGKSNYANQTDTLRPEALPYDPRYAFGPHVYGTNLNDNSGILRYVSIRHAGWIIPWYDETKALTMYAVGAGTTIEHVEAYSSNDDGFAWYGGNVNCKWLISAFNLDDAFDIDEGYTGKGQFWFGIKLGFQGNNIGELDGCINSSDASRASSPTLYNLTLIGSGPFGADKEDPILFLADGFKGKLHNSIISGARSPAANGVIRRSKHSWSTSAPYGNSGDSLSVRGNIF